MKERRHLRITSRQLKLAEIARREAMAALADAVGEEERSSALAQRSRDLARNYAARNGDELGESLRSLATFSRSLEQVAEQADEAQRDARQQAEWQVQTLAAAETRARRFEERMQAAQSVIEAIKAAREDASGPQMARKLQNGRGEA